jgi:hypothetical protein
MFKTMNDASYDDAMIVMNVYMLGVDYPLRWLFA